MHARPERVANLLLNRSGTQPQKHRSPKIREATARQARKVLRWGSHCGSLNQTWCRWPVLRFEYSNQAEAYFS